MNMIQLKAGNIFKGLLIGITSMLVTLILWENLTSPPSVSLINEISKNSPQIELNKLPDSVASYFQTHKSMTGDKNDSVLLETLGDEGYVSKDLANKLLPMNLKFYNPITNRGKLNLKEKIAEARLSTGHRFAVWHDGSVQEITHEHLQ
jgi:hypothetical protein